MDENNVASKELQTLNQSILICVVTEEYGTELTVGEVDG
jgi:hypothetical protein